MRSPTSRLLSSRLAIISLIVAAFLGLCALQPVGAQNYAYADGEGDPGRFFGRRATQYMEWSRFSGQSFKYLQEASRSKSQGAIYPFLECNRCLL